ncbi:bifunctional enoyl-CoA hydratase/phosphate acetyltransferase [Novosphingobium resinovorum]|uniref:Bifunctional enoyl-CoA hydratase/phosphate acetyltransferase n=1 Tax=Novosphingobium resinovorum TaxID=158500 RepID=A0A031JRD0_9SPHN|nr:MaoC family dehydratase [Novosphingobium resinovorum]EZP79328.1 bifunctional enoyl-CoA hydratase/phosphate acetyltransferase [Novosphingobium resinovorum]
MTSPRRYADLTVGAKFPEQPARYVVTQAAVDAYREIGGATGPVNAGEIDIAPPTLAAVYIRPAQNALNGPPGGIHAKQRFEFLVPVEVGDTLDTVLEVRELYERNGRNFVVSETVTTNQHGAKVCVGRITQVWGQEQ